MKRLAGALALTAVLLLTSVGMGYVINNWWPDGDDIVMDEVFLPTDTWSSPAQFQMSEYNEIHTTDNSHPFRINTSPQFSFGADDGDNTIGFLAEAGLSSEYGLSYASALAWAVCWSNFFTGRYNECDVMLDPTLPWNLDPDDNEWFQSTVLHELGHVQGLGHYNNFLSMQNSGTSKYLRNEILYMDDRVGVRQHSSTVSERDIVMYNKWHNGSTPQWMTMSPTTLREGQTVNLYNITVENRGSQAFSSTVRFGIYLSTNNIISTADTLLNTGSFGSFGTFTFSTFDWSATIPSTFNDCSTRWIGGIIDDNGVWSERYESNNDTAFTNGVAYSGETYAPTALTILLAEDAYEPNDSFAAASPISLNFYNSNLSIDTDDENDYYRFTVAQSGDIDIDAIFNHAAGDIDLELRNSSNVTIASSTTITSNEHIAFHIAPGTYRIRVYGFSGSSGNCNQYALDADFFPDQPDLTPLSMNAPNVGNPGQSISVYNQVKNIGDLAAGPFTVGLRLSTNTTCTTSDILIGSRSVSSLAVNATSTHTTGATIPSSPPGVYYLCVLADDQGSVTESDELNNTMYEAITIEWPIFEDSFESGNTSAWSNTVP